MKRTNVKRTFYLLLFWMVFQSAYAQTSGKSYALIIGISDYKDEEIPDLKFAHRDAEAFAAYLSSKAGGSLKPEQMTLLTNENASFGNIVVGLDWLSDVSKAGDRLLIYFAGHADVETKTVAKQGFLLAHDSPSTNYRSNSLGLDLLREYVNTFQRKNAKVILIADACHAGKLAGNQVQGRALTASSMLESFSNQIKILSCQPTEYALESTQWGEGRGVFSFYLIQGLLGMADQNQDKQVSLLELKNYLQQQVAAQTAPQSQIPQVFGGNLQEKISTVDPIAVEQIKLKKVDQTLIFAPAEFRGPDFPGLVEKDTSLVRLYRSFKKALQERRFFEPQGNSAEHYLNELKKSSKIEELLPIMKRQYAAALMEEVQKDVNRTLKDQEEIGERGDLEFLPQVNYAQSCIVKIIQLFGTNHYLGKPLLARKHHYESLKYYYQDVQHNSTFILKAIQEIEIAMAMDSLIADVYNTAAILFQENLDLNSAKAIELFEKASELAPNWAIPQLNLLFFWRNQRDSPKSISTAKRMMEIAPHRWFASYNLGLETGDEDPKQALPLYQQALSCPDFQPNVYLSISMAHRRLGDTTAAKAARAQYIDAIKVRLKTKPEDFRRYCSVLVDDILKKNAAADLAKTLITQLSIKPIDVYYGLGMYYSSRGSLFESAKKAAPYFQKVLEINPNHLGANYKMGMAYRFTAKNKAKYYFFKTFELDSTHIYAPLNLAMILASQSRFDSAVAVLNKAISIRPDFARNYAEMANVYGLKGDFKKQEEFLIKAHQCYEKDIVPIISLAGFYQDKQHDKALFYHKMASRIDSLQLNVLEFRLYMHQLLNEKKQWRQCIENYKKININNLYVRNLNWYFIKNNNLDSALFLIEKWGNEVWKNDPYDKAIKEASIYIKSKNWPKLEELSRELLKKYPGATHGNWGLSLVYDATEKYEEMQSLALQHLSKAPNEMDSTLWLCRLILANYRQNKVEESSGNINKMFHNSKNKGDAHYQLACVFNHLNMKEQTLQQLDLAFQNGLSFLIPLDDIEIDELIPTAEYQTLMKKHFPAFFRQ